MFQTSSVRPRIIKDARGDVFLPNRAANYWNRLPDWVKQKGSVTGLKERLEKFKRLNPTAIGHYWELSRMLLDKIPTESRDEYFSYLDENPIVAARAQRNLKP